jgi:hypothetical protein
MRSQTPVFIITSSRPRVGKTLIARTLTEYFVAQSRPVAAFDVNPDGFKLIDYLPAYTAAASLNDTRDEMALFDQLVANDQVPKVVDLGHALLDRFFDLMQQIDVAAEAQRRGVALAVLFVADSDERAPQGYAMLRSRFPDLALVPVLNEIIQPVSRYCANFPPTARGGDPVILPALSAVLRSVIDRRDFSFIAYAAKTTDTTSELYGWIRSVFLTFRELEVRLLLSGLLPRLRRSA